MLADKLKTMTEGRNSFYEEEITYLKSADYNQDAMQVELGYDRFKGCYIERVNKETEELQEEANSTLLDASIHEIALHKQDFYYLESDWFQLLGVNGFSLEVDDVFGHYSALLGLQLPKKAGSYLKEFLTGSLGEDQLAYSAMFNDREGLWEINLQYNVMDGFQSEQSIGELVKMLYLLLFNLVAGWERAK
ncbi:branched-chain amino acid aminotransferase [Bacillus lacus]|uniref:Branched-chain amino acid aminotransferase n=1 Tax=Metabacillus lacus TaxID=1983721 RepID=A0A7X2IWI1_9BACI|nr:branched-chain amino acid aminotransferase [Metabacillus lacus]MRX70752.1 branched-chain amino acid aminotransferase [Metabacillus lacus]